MIINLFKVFAPISIAFFVGIGITPLLTNYLYKHKLWKQKAGKVDPSGNSTPIFNKLHEHKEVGTPRMGGIIIWASAIITVLAIYLFSIAFPSDVSSKLNFLSRSQTWIPFGTLILGSLVGLIDDWLEVKGSARNKPGGLAFSKRLVIVILLGLAVACWFYFKLDLRSISIPFSGELYLGILSIPFFVLVMIALFSSGVIDGLDGLAGGVMAIIFATYTGLAYFENQIDLAAFCAVVTGGILAFLWFNIPPARFYMSETGILGLTMTLTVVAFLTNSVLMLPIIAFPLFFTVLTNVIQLGSKKLRGKKVFLIAPIHHHFEAIGWPAPKVVMRYWIIGVVMAVIGLITTLLSR
jgi:phospho-N-acetylmuramoyl-pentapeptide-transferase